jgi:hypothetical protein
MTKAVETDLLWAAYWVEHWVEQSAVNWVLNLVAGWDMAKAL